MIQSSQEIWLHNALYACKSLLQSLSKKFLSLFNHMSFIIKEFISQLKLIKLLWLKHQYFNYLLCFNPIIASVKFNLLKEVKTILLQYLTQTLPCDPSGCYLIFEVLKKIDYRNYHFDFDKCITPAF
jgi:hypothetical protein